MIAICLIILGFLIRWLAMSKLGPRFTLVLIPQDDIETKGIYRYIRHPSYLGSIIVTLGASLLHPACGIVYVSCYFFLARMVNEEFILSQNPKYIEYMKTTGRLLPKIRR